MNTFITDLHIHSRFSRATSHRLTISHLAAWSAIKGIDVLATGDITHPVWREELRASLTFDPASGLYRMNGPFNIDVEAPGYALPPGADARGPLFMLETEISSIYKRGGSTRKVHNLVYLPDFDSADRLCAKLGQIGNLKSDGRPILGLDSEKLLEIVLDTDPRAVLIPAHIWTPWFSLFGSKSGFDAIHECFGDLSDRIFAMETGLSSDPDMNRLWSELDRIVMVSNSDAHSGENLGREGTVFHGTPSYDGIFAALRKAATLGAAEAARRSEAALREDVLPDGETCLYGGTLEFFPEEGKYHLDGHRKCGVMLTPLETRRLGGICPVCGGPVTVGVLNRVMALADRTMPDPPAGTGFVSLVPLAELVAECLRVGPKSIKAQSRTAETIAKLGSEFSILREVPVNKIRAFWPALAEAVGRMRAGDVIRQGGYDGEYGVVRVLSGGGRAHDGTGCASGTEQGTFSDIRNVARAPASDAASLSGPVASVPSVPLWVTLMSDAALRSGSGPTADPVSSSIGSSASFVWSPAQTVALHAGPGPVLVIAGPGAGKTRTLIGRMRRLLEEDHVPPSDIVAVTFTRRAAAELAERLGRSVGGTLPEADTLHAFALRTVYGMTPPAVLSEEAARALFLSVAGISGRTAHEAFERIAFCRETLASFPDELAGIAVAYAEAKRRRGLVDYTDLLEEWVRVLEQGGRRGPWRELLVDEVQDLSPLQLRLLRLLVGSQGNGFFGIGDPDQSIYAFRGAQPDIEHALRVMWPALQTLSLTESYRSGKGILDSASAVLGPCAHGGHLSAVRSLTTTLRLCRMPDASLEADWIAGVCGSLIGATSHTLQDASARTEALSGICSPVDIAILVRIKALAAPIAKALQARGVPCSVPEAEAFWMEPRIAIMLNLAARHLGRSTDVPTDVPMPRDVAFGDGPRGVLNAVSAVPPFDDLLSRLPAFHAFERRYAECGGWASLLDWLEVRQELDAVREAGETVRIMTVHAAKGLEFRAVFLPAMEDGVFPFVGPDGLQKRNSVIGEAAMAEERRLFYVGLTRASEAVYISHARSRTLYGVSTDRRPSRLLADLPKLFTESRLVRHVRTEQRQLSLISLRDTVHGPCQGGSTS